MLTDREILEALQPCSFEELTCENSEGLIWDNIGYSIFDSFNTGATKIVLFSNKEEFVVKIPFTHCENEYWDDEMEEYTWGVVEFRCAGEPDGWDYCEAETIYYESAEEHGLEYAFLKTEKIGYVDWHPVYRQPKAEMLETRREMSEKDWKECQKASDYCTSKHIRCFNSYWVADFLNYYGETAFEDLSHFLEEMGIWDLHEGNLGYIDGKPIIVDYGGFHE